jgi:flagellar biosynthetic protein FliO
LSPELAGASLKMVGSLAMVLGLILVLFYAIKRFRPRSLHSSQVPEMRLLGTLNLAPKRALALVELHDQWMVVGVGTDSVTLVTKMDRPPEPEPEEAPVLRSGRSFQAFLQQSRLRHPRKGMTAKRSHEDS